MPAHHQAVFREFVVESFASTQSQRRQFIIPRFSVNRESFSGEKTATRRRARNCVNLPFHSRNAPERVKSLCRHINRIKVSVPPFSARTNEPGRTIIISCERINASLAPVFLASCEKI